MTSKRAILIAGPTASGKSAKALEIALTRNGVIVNADSVQIYNELRIISARPSVADEDAVPHYLYGAVSGATRYSVGAWICDVKKELAGIESSGRTPIFVGGTGLYFKALTEGLVDVPPTDEMTAEKWRQREIDEGPQQLHRILSERDPDLAIQLERGDSQRIVRALTVLESTGQSLLDWQRKKPPTPLIPLGDCEALFLDADRDWLYTRINRRFDEMIKQGGLDEARNLMVMNLDPNLPIMKAHGVPRLMAHLKGELDLAAAIEKAKTDTRRYAKRQKTWFRTQMPGWSWLSVGQ